MNEILESLVRLMAPVLSFTADEIWQHMTGKERTPSVHTELFVPVNPAYQDPELAGRWEDLIAFRKEVTKALELARKDKVIGHPLDASVKIGLSPDLMEKIAPYREQLRSIFIVSLVDIKGLDEIDKSLESETLPGLRIKISPSTDSKCERCWVHDPSVGDDTSHPTICKRCIQALAEME
jgi:isoleucyl-tRNA synthetase